MKISWKLYKDNRYGRLLGQVCAKAREKDTFVITLPELDRDLYERLVREAENFDVSIDRPCEATGVGKIIEFTISVKGDRQYGQMENT